MKSFIQNFWKISYQKKKKLLFFLRMLLTLLPNIVFSHSTLQGQTALNNELLDFITVLQTLFSGNTKLLRAFSPKISEPALSFESTSHVSLVVLS